MKKYLLGGLLTLVGIFNFTSAGSLDLNCEGRNCEPSTFNVEPGNLDYTCNLSCVEDEHYAEVRLFNQYSEMTTFFTCNNNSYQGGGSVSIGNDASEPTNGQVVMNGECNGTINLNGTAISVGGGGEGGEGGEGGIGGNIVAGGISAFSGIIDRLGGIFGEFGPYIIYIAIACLGISLLFKALKYILGFTNNSAKNSIGGNRESRRKRKFNKFIGMRNRRNRRRFNRRHKNRPQRYNKIKYELNERR